LIRALALVLLLLATPAAAQSDAAAPVVRLHDRLIALTWPPDRAAVERLVAQNFDLPVIAREVLGGSGASPAQRTRMATVLGARLSREIVRAGPFDAKDGFTVLGRRSLGKGEWLITTRARPPGEDAPVTLAWRVRQAGGRQTVVDVLRDGVSTVGTLRDDVRTALRRQSIDAAIEQMERRASR
jgi:ABC-type transporter MlaC component